VDGNCDCDYFGKIERALGEYVDEVRFLSAALDW
jgi:hypothetical protein